MPKYTPPVAISPEIRSAVEDRDIPPSNRFTRRAIAGDRKRRDKRPMSRSKQASQDAPVDINERLGYCLSFCSAHAVEYEICGRRGVAMTAEHAYQASKFHNWDITNEVLHALGPEEAKAIAHQHRAHYRPDWSDATKLKLYESIARAKADQHQVVREHLRRTGARKIIANYPGNDFWGLGHDKTGRNHAGKIWVKIRADLPPI